MDNPIETMDRAMSAAQEFAATRTPEEVRAEAVASIELNGIDVADPSLREDLFNLSSALVSLVHLLCSAVTPPVMQPSDRVALLNTAAGTWSTLAGPFLNRLGDTFGPSVSFTVTRLLVETLRAIGYTDEELNDALTSDDATLSPLTPTVSSDDE